MEITSTALLSAIRLIEIAGGVDDANTVGRMGHPTATALTVRALKSYACGIC